MFTARLAHARRFRDGRRGFTLIELIVVVIIIAILAAIGVVAYNQWTSHARDAEILASATHVRDAIEAKAADDDLNTNAEVAAVWPADPSGGAGTAALKKAYWTAYDGTLTFYAGPDSATAGEVEVHSPVSNRSACIHLTTSTMRVPTVTLGHCDLNPDGGSADPTGPQDPTGGGGTAIDVGTTTVTTCTPPDAGAAVLTALGKTGVATAGDQTVVTTSDDGSLMAVVDTTAGKFTILTVTDGCNLTVTSTLDIPAGPCDATFTPGGTDIVLVYKDTGKVVVVHLGTGGTAPTITDTATVPAGPGCGCHGTVTSGGTVVVTSGTGSAGSIVTYPVAGTGTLGTPVATPVTLPGVPTQVVPAPGAGKTVVVAGDGGTATYTVNDDGTVTYISIVIKEKCGCHAAFAGGGAYVLVVDENAGTLTVYSNSNGTLTQTDQVNVGPACDVAVAPDGVHITVTGTDGTLTSYTLDKSTGKLTKTGSVSAPGCGCSAAYSGDGGYVFVTDPSSGSVDTWAAGGSDGGSTGDTVADFGSGSGSHTGDGAFGDAGGNLTVTTVAGAATASGTADGVGTAARLGNVSSLTVLGGKIYMATPTGIRSYDPATGQVGTVANAGTTYSNVTTGCDYTTKYATTTNKIEGLATDGTLLYDVEEQLLVAQEPCNMYASPSYGYIIRVIDPGTGGANLFLDLGRTTTAGLVRGITVIGKYLYYGFGDIYRVNLSNGLVADWSHGMSPAVVATDSPTTVGRDGDDLIIDRVGNVRGNSNNDTGYYYRISPADYDAGTITGPTAEGDGVVSLPVTVDDVNYWYTRAGIVTTTGHAGLSNYALTMNEIQPHYAAGGTYGATADGTGPDASFSATLPMNGTGVTTAVGLWGTDDHLQSGAVYADGALYVGDGSTLRRIAPGTYTPLTVPPLFGADPHVTADNVPGSLPTLATDIPASAGTPGTSVFVGNTAYVSTSATIGSNGAGEVWKVDRATGHATLLAGSASTYTVTAGYGHGSGEAFGYVNGLRFDGAHHLYAQVYKPAVGGTVQRAYLRIDTVTGATTLVDPSWAGVPFDSTSTVINYPGSFDGAQTTYKQGGVSGSPQLDVVIRGGTDTPLVRVAGNIRFITTDGTSLFLVEQAGSLVVLQTVTPS